MARYLLPIVAALALAPAARPQPAVTAPDNAEYLRVDHDRTGRFGITVVAGPESGKLLTYSSDGGTNNTAVSVNGQAFVLNAVAPTAPTAEAKGDDGRGWTTTWDVANLKVKVVQRVALVRGPQTSKLDTALVKYTLTNTATKKQKVGLRFMLDTLIGRNDGVPFVVPERADLVTTTAVTGAKTKDLPEYVQAFERPDFKNPGTVAHLGVRVSAHYGVFDLPDSLVISHWPGSNAPWAYPINSLTGDSAVGLYWTERPLNAGEERQVGFTYGLAKVASGKSGGKIGLTAGGAAKTGGTVTVVAYLDRALKQPTAEIQLPAGLKLAAGQRAKQTATVRPADPYGRLTWRVVCEQAGAHKLTVALPDGTAEELDLTVR